MQRAHFATLEAVVYFVNAVAGVRHINICDECGERGLRGIRWKCGVCRDYDLCHGCYMSDKHTLSHAFIRYDTPISVGYKLTQISIAKNQFKTLLVHEPRHSNSS